MSSSNLINLMTLIWNLPLNFDVAFCNWLDKFLPPTGTFLTCRVGFHLGSERCTTKMRKEPLQEGMGYGDIEWACFVGSGLLGDFRLLAYSLFFIIYIYKRCYVYNNFTTNYMWLVVIGSNLKLTARLPFCPNNNN